MKTSSDLIHAFAAGFFVGEGSIIVIRKMTNKGNVRHVLNCCVTNTEIELLHFLEANYYGRVRPRKGTLLSKKPLWEWRVEGAKAELFLLKIQPFLKGVKLAKANYAIQLRSLMRGNRMNKDLRGRAQALSTEQINERDNILKLIKTA